MRYTQTAGLRSRMIFNFDTWVEPPGALCGAVRVDGEALAAEAAEVKGRPALVFPRITEPGLYLFEVRGDGKPLILDHLEVLPSPLAPVEGVTDQAVEVAEQDLHVTVVQNPGPQGLPGQSAYDLALSMGYTGSKEDFIRAAASSKQEVLEAILPFFGSNYTKQGGSESDNMQVFYLKLGAEPNSNIFSVTLQTGAERNDAIPTYAALYERTPNLGQDNNYKLIGVSSNAQVCSEPGEFLRWEFAIYSAALHAQELYIFFGDKREFPLELDALHPITDSAFTARHALQLNGWWEVTGYTRLTAAAIQGKSAYELACAAGFSGSVEEWLASLIGPTGEPGPKGEPGMPGQDGASPSPDDVAAALLPMIAAEFTYEGPAAANNWHASYFTLGENYMPEGTALTEFGYRVRFDSIAGCTTDPVYLGIWERAENGVDWELRGVSLNTQTQAQSVDVMWQFDASKVRLHGRPIRVCLMAAPEDGWRTDLTMGLRVSDVTAANTAIYLNDQSWQKAPKFFLRGYKPVDALSMGGSGQDGESAYDIAVRNGFEGSEAAWLESLKGAPGEVDTERVMEIVNSELVGGEITVNTPPATSQAGFNYFQISSLNLRGRLKRVQIAGRTGSLAAMTTSARYLGVFQEIGGEWRKVAVSTNAVAQAVGTVSVWLFAEDSAELAPAPTRFCLLTSAAGGWDATGVFGACVYPVTNAGDFVIYNGMQSAIAPQASFLISREGLPYAPLSHVGDTSHLAAAEREKLNKLLATGGGAGVDDDYVMEDLAPGVDRAGAGYEKLTCIAFRGISSKTIYGFEFEVEQQEDALYDCVGIYAYNHDRDSNGKPIFSGSIGGGAGGQVRIRGGIMRILFEYPLTLQSQSFLLIFPGNLVGSGQQGDMVCPPILTRRDENANDTISTTAPQSEGYGSAYSQSNPIKAHIFGRAIIGMPSGNFFYDDGCGFIGSIYNDYNPHRPQTGIFTIKVSNPKENCETYVNICACGSWLSDYFLNGKAGLVIQDYHIDRNNPHVTPSYMEYYASLDQIFQLAYHADELLALLKK